MIMATDGSDHARRAFDVNIFLKVINWILRAKLEYF